MFTSPTPPARTDDGSIMPLINVVFLLLIFFMLAGTLAATDPFRIEPPSSDSEWLTEAEALVVLVAADGRLAVDGETLTPDALRQAIADRMADAPTLQVRLKADGSADADRVISVMEDLREAGVERLQLMTVVSGS